MKSRSVPETPEGGAGQHTEGGRGEAQVKSQRHLKEAQARTQREAEVKRRSVPETPEAQASTLREAEVKCRSVPETPEGDAGEHAERGRGEVQVSPTTDT